MSRMKLMIGAVLVALCIASNVMAEQVVMSSRGKKYHKPTCKLMLNKEVKTMEKEEALEKNISPCRRCYKEDVIVEEVTE